MKKLLPILFMLFACITTQAQDQSPKYTLLELQSRFKHKNYTEKVLLEFQKELENLRITPELHEYIPGEVIAWSLIDGRFAMLQVYLVENDSIRAVEALPKDSAFLAKLNTFVPEKSRFAYNSDLWSFPYVYQKLENGFYLIKVAAKSFNSYPEMPNDDILRYDVEYITTDFVHFDLVRLKDIHATEWIEVRE